MFIATVKFRIEIFFQGPGPRQNKIFHGHEKKSRILVIVCNSLSQIQVVSIIKIYFRSAVTRTTLLAKLDLRNYFCPFFLKCSVVKMFGLICLAGHFTTKR